MSLYLNIDGNTANTPFLNKLCSKGDFSSDAFFPFIDRYADSQITDILLNIFCQYSNTPSKVFTTAAEKYLQKYENNIPVDYTSTAKDEYENYTFAHELSIRNIDPFQIWINRCYEKNIHPWISIRMNDCHCPDEETSFLRSDFFYKAKKNGWMIGKEYGYFRNCFNYSVPEVREIMLDYIKEQLTQYDVYGIELDYLREIYCFDYLHDPECYKILNHFMREVKRIVNDVEKRVNHPIRIGVRVIREIEQNKVFGLDVETWVKEDLIDLICVSPRWASCDNAMPIDQWKKKFPGKEIVAGFETFQVRQGKGASSDPEVVTGMSNAYYSLGADGLYLFNYFIYKNCSIERTNKIIHKCGDPTACLLGPRRHIMTYQDTAPKGYSKYNPLPVQLDSEKTLTLLTGEILKDSRVELIIGVAGVLPDNDKIYINGKVCSSFYPIDVYGYDEGTCTPFLNGYCGNDVKTYACDISGKTDGIRQIIEFNTDPAVTVSYLEIRVL